MKNDPFLFLGDFDWENDAYSLLYKYDAMAADAISVQSEFAFSMTKNMFCMTEKDTSELRSAVVHYLLALYGISNDGFNYGTVNDILHITLKSWIKKVCCSPEYL